ncbi:hypothetical protein ABT096_30605 [Streptomyces sp. NPDC002561]|uniref:hypothetical protein n=1 Tax=Streptomyces sp. NPDC002561 TaxID=3154418 RepID=UPI00331F03DF
MSGAQDLQAAEVAEGLGEFREAVAGYLQHPEVPEGADGFGQPGQPRSRHVEFFQSGEFADACVECAEVGAVREGQDAQSGEGEQLLREAAEPAFGEVEFGDLVGPVQQRVQLLQRDDAARAHPGAQHLASLAHGLLDLPRVGLAVLVQQFGQQDAAQFPVGEVDGDVGAAGVADEEGLRLLGEVQNEVQHADDDRRAGAAAHREDAAVVPVRAANTARHLQVPAHQHVRAAVQEHVPGPQGARHDEEVAAAVVPPVQVAVDGEVAVHHGVVRDPVLVALRFQVPRDVQPALVQPDLLLVGEIGVRVADPVGDPEAFLRLLDGDDAVPGG